MKCCSFMLLSLALDMSLKNDANDASNLNPSNFISSAVSLQRHHGLA